MSSRRPFAKNFAFGRPFVHFALGRTPVFPGGVARADCLSAAFLQASVPNPTATPYNGRKQITAAFFRRVASPIQGCTLLVAFLLTIASVAAVKIVLTVYYDKIEAKSPMDF